MSELSVPSTEIMNLNDDCLLTLLEYIPFEKCVSLVGKLNSRFDYLIMKELKYFTKHELSLKNAPSFNKEEWQIVAMILKSFVFNSCPDTSCNGFINILRPIFESCLEAGNLTTLLIRHTWWHRHVIDAVKPIMPQIIYHTISGSVFPNFKRVVAIINDIPELHKFQISNSVTMPPRVHFIDYREHKFTYIGHGQPKNFFTVKVTIQNFYLPRYVEALCYKFVTEETQDSTK